MKKRYSIRMHLRFGIIVILLSLLFVSFQNFGPAFFYTEVQNHLQKNYQPKESIPRKSVEHIERFYSRNQFLSIQEKNKYFDHKKFLKDKLKESRLYTRVHNLVEIPESNLSPNSADTKTETLSEEDNFKLKVDPLKAKAMFRYIGSFHADLGYSGDDSDIELKVHKALNESSKIQLEHSSEDDKTWLQYQINW